MGTLVCRPPTPPPTQARLTPLPVFPAGEWPDLNAAEALDLEIWAAADEVTSVTQFVGAPPGRSRVRRPPPPPRTGGPRAACAPCGLCSALWGFILTALI